MTIIKRSKPVEATTETEKALDKVIDAAPDGKGKGVIQGNKQQISVGFDPEFLREIDELRKKMGGLSRPAFITLACRNLMRQGIVIGGRDSD
jgi:hypothetical protein